MQTSFNLHSKRSLPKFARTTHCSAFSQRSRASKETVTKKPKTVTIETISSESSERNTNSCCALIPCNFDAKCDDVDDYDDGTERRSENVNLEREKEIDFENETTKGIKILKFHSSRTSLSLLANAF